MKPNPGEILWLATRVDLAVKKIRHRRVVKLDTGPVTALIDEANILQQERLARSRNPKGSDLCRADVTPK
jgi:hypothetical protein